VSISARNADRIEAIPLGYGRVLYFWSFVVALLFFTLGAGFSIFEGLRRMISPADIRSPIVIYVVLAAEALFDGASWVLASRAFSTAKGDLGYWQAMKWSKDPPSFIVGGRGSSAVSLLRAPESVGSTTTDPPTFEGRLLLRRVDVGDDRTRSINFMR
jgi:hypothetical protein